MSGTEFGRLAAQAACPVVRTRKYKPLVCYQLAGLCLRVLTTGLSACIRTPINRPTPFDSVSPFAPVKAVFSGPVRYPQSSLDAIRAPSASDSSFAHITCGWTR